MGSDPSTDVAVLRLNAVGDVPVVTIGDSSKLSVGQVCRETAPPSRGLLTCRALVGLVLRDRVGPSDGGMLSSAVPPDTASVSRGECCLEPTK